MKNGIRKFCNKGIVIFMVSLVIGLAISSQAIASYAATTAQSNKVYINQAALELRCAQNKGATTDETVNPVFSGYKSFTKESLLNKFQYQSFDADGRVIPNSEVTIDEATLNELNAAIEKKYTYFNENGITEKVFSIKVTSLNGQENTFTVKIMRGGDLAQVDISNLKLKATDVEYDISKGILTWDQLRAKDMGNVFGYYPSRPDNTYFEENPPTTIGVESYFNELNNAIADQKVGTYTVYAIWATGDTTGFIDIVPFQVTLYKLADVTFESNGGNLINPIKQIKTGTTVTEPKAPVKDGFTFAGWYKDKAMTDKWDFANDTVEDTMTLYAKWTPVQSGGENNNGSDNSGNSGNTPSAGDGTTSSGSNTLGAANTTPRTGDDTMLTAYELLILMSFGLIGIIVFLRKSTNENID